MPAYDEELLASPLGITIIPVPQAGRSDRRSPTTVVYGLGAAGFFAESTFLCAPTIASRIESGPRVFINDFVRLRSPPPSPSRRVIEAKRVRTRARLLLDRGKCVHVKTICVPATSSNTPSQVTAPRRRDLGTVPPRRTAGYFTRFSADVASTAVCAKRSKKKSKVLDGRPPKAAYFNPRAGAGSLSTGGSSSRSLEPGRHSASEHAQIRCRSSAQPGRNSLKFAAGRAHAADGLRHHRSLARRRPWRRRSSSPPRPFGRPASPGRGTITAIAGASNWFRRWPGKASLPILARIFPRPSFTGCALIFASRSCR